MDSSWEYFNRRARSGPRTVYHGRGVICCWTWKHKFSKKTDINLFSDVRLLLRYTRPVGRIRWELNLLDKWGSISFPKMGPRGCELLLTQILGPSGEEQICLQKVLIHQNDLWFPFSFSICLSFTFSFSFPLSSSSPLVVSYHKYGVCIFTKSIQSGTK